MSLGGSSAPDTSINWAPEQCVIFEKVAETDDSLGIQAVAGSGKTTTIVEAMKYIPQKKNAIFVCFNKDIQMELSSRIPMSVQSKTLHALCRQVINANVHCKLWKTKTNIILEKYLQSIGNPGGKDYFFEIKYMVRRIISLMKASSTTMAWEEHIYKSACMQVGVVDEDYLGDTVYDIWLLMHNESNEYYNTMDFDDMLRIPIIRGMKFPKYDIIFVDEAQDLNPIQHEILARMLSDTGRIVAVGDSHQAIYAFRGALSDSMEKLDSRFGLIPLPLSVTYRCASSIVEQAKRFNPHIRAHPSSPTGSVTTMSEQEMYRTHISDGVLKGGIMVLCRYNAPLIRAAIKYIIHGQPVYLMGRDCVPGLVATARSIEKDTGFLNPYQIEQWCKRMCEGAHYAKVQYIQDSCNAVLLCYEEGCRTVKDVERKLYTLFPSEPPRYAHIKLCTIHKSKGLEAGVVMILRPEALPRYAKFTDDVSVEEKQEENIHYVAITRAKRDLIYITKSSFEDYMMGN